MKQYFVEDALVTLGAFLDRLGETKALADGRVFLLAKRMGVSDWGRSLRRGERVMIGSSGIAKKGIPANELLPVLHEDTNYLAVSKPSGISTVPDLSNASDSLVHRVAAQSSLPPDSLFPSSRLDRQVSGVVLFAKSKHAYELLQDARANGRYERTYVGLAHGSGDLEDGIWRHGIARSKNPMLRKVAERASEPQKEAETHFRFVAKKARLGWLVYRPVTGRTHQIRLHTANAGWPLLGDQDYGGPKHWTYENGRRETFSRIYLHCWKVQVGLKDSQLALHSSIPEIFARVWSGETGSSPPEEP